MYIVPVLASILACVLFAASRTVTGDVKRLQDWMRRTNSEFRIQNSEFAQRRRKS